MSETTTTVQNPTGYGEWTSHIERINGQDNAAAIPGIAATAGQRMHVTEDFFDMMTDEQNERLIAALESIAGSMDKSLALLTTPRPVPPAALQPPKPAEVKPTAAAPVTTPSQPPEPPAAAPTLHAG